MFQTHFPDIDMVKKLSNEPLAPANIWKNTALNVKCKEVYRAGIESPYSLFMNNKGFSYCNVNGRQYRVETDSFLLTRPGERYDLIIDNLQQTEIFNIHINKQFFDALARSLTAPDDALINDPNNTGDHSPYLFTQLYPKDDRIQVLMQRIAQTGTDKEAFELALANLLTHLLMTDNETSRKMESLPVMSATVKAEIYQRLATAKDHIHSNYLRAVDLDELSKETAMSKFHFLRMFKSLYGFTPHQYLTKVRMDKAVTLLKNTSEPVNTISDQLGFEYPNSFIKAFQKAYGIAPLQYRKA